MGLLCSLQWLQDWEADHVVFELDCKTVINAIHSSKIDVSEFGIISSLCKKFLSHHPNYTFARSAANMVAHHLVRGTMSECRK